MSFLIQIVMARSDIYPRSEKCDGVDNDCNDLIDNDRFKLGLKQWSNPIC